MRRELGRDLDPLMDTNSCNSPARTLEAGHLLQGHGFCQFEEHCPYWELKRTKEVADAQGIDVTSAEKDCDLSTWKRMTDMRTVDIVPPNILDLGGICRTFRSGRMAQAAGLPVTPY